MRSGSLSRFAAVAANTYRETVRQRVLYSVVFFALLMTLSGLLVGELSIRQDEKIIKDIGLAAMDFFGLLIAVFIGVGLVSTEVERRSVYPLLSKPLSRGEFLLGKFAGLGLTLLVTISLMSLGLFATLLSTGHGGSWHLLQAIYPIYLGLLLVVAFALLFSSLTSVPLAAILTVGLVVAGRYADVIRNMREVAPSVPAWLARFLYYAIPNFQNFDLKNRVAYGDPVPAEAFLWISGYGVTYIAIALGLALLVFRTKEFQ